MDNPPQTRTGTGSLEQRLRGTPRAAVLIELLTNSLHFPLANIFLEMLQEGVQDYLGEPDLYAMLVAATVQAWFLGRWNHRGLHRQFVGNLIGPALYTLAEASIEGPGFFLGAHHLAYWAFALAIGLLQQSGPTLRGLAADACLVTEHVVRTSILLVMYALFEAADEPSSRSIGGFLASDSHRYMALVIPLLGVVIGFAAVNSRRYLALLRETAARLRQYSGWFLGEDLLNDAIRDQERLLLQRRERTVLFMDVRGFTAWSETQSPETVVAMLNACFNAAEDAWREWRPIKIKHTGDEIMAVFAAPEDAVHAALAARDATAPLLSRLGLAAGTGIHTGVLVEGLLGSRDVKGYDVIGDTVNTAKRLCDQAQAGEVLVSTGVAGLSGQAFTFGPPRDIQAKGKREPVRVLPVSGRALR